MSLDIATHSLGSKTTPVESCCCGVNRLGSRGQNCSFKVVISAAKLFREHRHTWLSLKTPASSSHPRWEARNSKQGGRQASLMETCSHGSRGNFPRPEAGEDPVRSLQKSLFICSVTHWNKTPLSRLTIVSCTPRKGFPGGSAVNNLPLNAGATGDAGSIPGGGRSPGEGNGSPL